MLTAFSYSYVSRTSAWTAAQTSRAADVSIESLFQREDALGGGCRLGDVVPLTGLTSSLAVDDAGSRAVSSLQLRGSPLALSPSSKRRLSGALTVSLGSSSLLGVRVDRPSAPSPVSRRLNQRLTRLRIPHTQRVGSIRSTSAKIYQGVFRVVILDCQVLLSGGPFRPCVSQHSLVSGTSQTYHVSAVAHGTLDLKSLSFGKSAFVARLSR